MTIEQLTEVIENLTEVVVDGYNYIEVTEDQVGLIHEMAESILSESDLWDTEELFNLIDAVDGFRPPGTPAYFEGLSLKIADRMEELLNQQPVEIDDSELQKVISSICMLALMEDEDLPTV